MTELAEALPDDALFVDDSITTRASVYGALDFVEEHGDRIGRVGQNDFPEKLDEALLAEQRVFVLPPGLQIDFEAQLAHDAVSNAVVPAAGVLVVATRSDLGQIDDRGELPFLTQAAYGARHQTGLARCARAQYVTELLIGDTGEQRIVRGALDVTGTIRLHRAADDKEFRCLSSFGHARIVAGASWRQSAFRSQEVRKRARP